MLQLTVGRYNRGPRNILQKLFFAEGTFNGTGFVYRTGHTVSRLISTANPATNFRVRVKPRELGSPSQRAAGCVCPVSGFWSWHCLVRWRNSPTVSRPHFSWPACSMFATLHVCRIAAVAFGFASGLLLPIVWGFGKSTHSVRRRPIAQTQSTRRTTSLQHIPCPLCHLLFQVGRFKEKLGS